MLNRIKELNRYQKTIVLLLVFMFVVFTIAYPLISSRKGYAYRESILCIREESQRVVYSGLIDGEEAIFTVTEDKTVTFHYGDKRYGPYTAREDPSAIPDDDLIGDYMTGVEIRMGDDVFFRGGVYCSDFGLVLYNEDGTFHSPSTIIQTSNDTVVSTDGEVVDSVEPDAVTILELMGDPDLTSKGEGSAWLCGTAIIIVTIISLLFADEIFRWNLAFRIQSAERAEPSEWEIIGRYVCWTMFTVIALIVYIIGLG